MKKYELTSNTKIFLGRTLYQIRALVSFASVEKDELGGFIEKESNLNQYGDAWVSGDARVYGNARVSGDARVYGNARVYGDAWVSGDARVYGDARVSGNARVYGNAEASPLTIGGLIYLVTITDNHIKIGCEFHSMIDWFAFDDKRIIEMDGKNALTFWQTWKQPIMDICIADGRYANRKTEAV